jgi:NADPH:quinone reductase-like Zn-dependent oxidoreductase
VQAIAYNEYGTPDVLQLRDVVRPEPLDDEVLINVHAASVNAYDWHFLTADVFLIRLISGGLLRPKRTTLGADVAGKIAAIGKNVTRFRLGDDVFGVAKRATGGFAEFVRAPEKSLESKPENISFDEAAAVPIAAITALQGLRDKGRIKPGHDVLIHGASGGVGTFAIQIARSFGAHVTAVCSSGNVERARLLGANRVIDYTADDFSARGERYDLIFVANGNRSLFDYKRALKPNGICVLAGGGSGSVGEIVSGLALATWISKTSGNKMMSFLARITQGDLTAMKRLIESGAVKPVIDRRFPLQNTADAMRYFGHGHTKGKVVITMNSSRPAAEPSRISHLQEKEI